MTMPSSFPNAAAVRVMLGAHEGWLKIALPSSAEVAVIGWVQQAASVDTGVPENIVALFSRALTRSFRVTFIDPEQSAPLEWLAHKDRWTRSLPASGWAALFHSKGITLVSTSEPQVARALFDTAGAWSQEAQVVLMTNPGPLPPDLRDHVLAGLLQKGRLEESSGLSGLLVPGPDGDFAQFVALQEGSLSRFLKYLEDEAASAGIPFEVISPQAFAQTRWIAEEMER